MAYEQNIWSILVFYKTFFGVELSFFSHGPKVVFWTNCAFPLKSDSHLSNEFVWFDSMKALWKLWKIRIATRDNGNVQSHDQEESKLNSTINANNGAHTLTHNQIIKSPFNENNLATIKTNRILTKILLLDPVE